LKAWGHKRFDISKQICVREKKKQLKTTKIINNYTKTNVW